jgi:AraC-like DNA-binding protein
MLVKMDFYDIISSMKEFGAQPCVSGLRPGLWADTVFGTRRAELVVPLYAERYRGPRGAAVYGSHDFWEFTAVTGGSGFFHCGGCHPMEEGTVILVPPGTPHRERSEKNVETIWLGFKADLPGVAGGRPHILNSPAMAARLESFWEFARVASGPSGPELDGMLLALTGAFFRLLGESERCGRSAMGDAARYLEDHFNEDISMPELAAALKCSPGHFFRRFREFAGMPPGQYLSAVRARKAMFYLRNTKLRIHQIASLCGFRDPYYFSRFFTRFSGASPSAYRGGARTLSSDSGEIFSAPATGAG